MTAYYNEIDPFAAAWLRELIKAGLIAQGDVDERDIRDVLPSDLAGYTQCHFFAGIGGWSYALRLAGFPDGGRVWTGSCPCQPFSTAGLRNGIADERHLWPAFYWLINQCRPAIVFGEQVESKAGRLWLAGVRSDLETLDYAVGCTDLCAASVSAPHGRPRLYWMAQSNSSPRQEKCPITTGELEGSGAQGINQRLVCDSTGIALGLADAEGSRCGEGETLAIQGNSPQRSKVQSQSRDDGQLSWRSKGLGSNHHGLVNTDGYHSHWWSGPLQVGRNCCEAEITRGGRQYRAQWRIKPGLPIVAHGIPNRVGKLCGYGNAIIPQVAEAFIRSAMEAIDEAA